MEILNENYLKTLEENDLEWDVEYQMLDGEDEPGIITIEGEAAKNWMAAKGWSEEQISKTGLIEFNQNDVKSIHENALKEGKSSAHDKILLDYLIEQL